MVMPSQPVIALLVLQLRVAVPRSVSLAARGAWQCRTSTPLEEGLDTAVPFPQSDTPISTGAVVVLRPSLASTARWWEVGAVVVNPTWFRVECGPCYLTIDSVP